MKCFILCVVVALSLFLVPSFGSKVVIYNATQFIELFTSTCNTDVELGDDIDMSTQNLFHPLCLKQDGTCEPFSGFFNGKGHSIKGLNMNMDDSMESDAGLFCGLKGAVFQDFVIDSTCSFQGTLAGSLAPYTSGSLSARNIINHAFVKGEQHVGGLIGMIDKLEKEDMVVFDECVNYGIIIGEHCDAGGLVGNTNCSIGDNQVRFLNCENLGNISSLSGESCELVCDNSGIVQKVALNSNMKNKRAASGIKYTSDLHAQTARETTSFNVTITGVITVTVSVPAGTLLGNMNELKGYFNEQYAVVNPSNNAVYASTTPVNSAISVKVIQKHKVTITGVVTKEVYVMPGTLLGNMDELKGYFNGQYAIVNPSNNAVYASSTPVNSAISVKVVQKHKVTITGSVSKNVFVMPGTLLKNIDELKSYFNEQYAIVNPSNNAVYPSDTPVNSAIFVKVVQKHKVTITGVLTQDVFVMPGTLLNNIDELKNYFNNQQYAVVNPSNNAVYASTTPVNSAISVKVIQKHKVTITGFFSDMVYVMPGTHLDDIDELKNYFNEQYAIVNPLNNEIYPRTTPVYSAISVQVVKKHLVKFTGFFSDNVYVMPGTRLGNIEEIKGYFNNIWYAVLNPDTNSAYSNNMNVNGDIDVQVVQKLSVKTNGVLSRTDYVMPKTQLMSLENYSDFFENNNYYYVYDSESKTSYSSNSIITTNISVQVDKLFTVAITGFTTAIIHKIQGETIGSITELKKYFEDKTRFAVCTLDYSDCELFDQTITKDITIVVVKKCIVSISGIVIEAEYVMPNTQLDKVQQLKNYWNIQYAVVDLQDTMKTYSGSTVVTGDMSVKVIKKFHITWQGHVSGNAYVLPRSTLGSVSTLGNLLNEYALIPVNQNKNISQSFEFTQDLTIDVCRTVQVCNVSICLLHHIRRGVKFAFNTGLYHLVEEKNIKTLKYYTTGNTVNSNLKLYLCSKVTVENNDTISPFLVKQGQGLGEGTSLSHFLDPNSFYDIREASGTKLFSSSSTLTSDINVVIVDQCPSFTKERCLQASEHCTWDSSKDGCGRNNNAPRGNTIEIALAVFCVLLIVVVIVAIVIIVLQIKKKPTQMNDIEMVEAGSFETKLGKDSLVIPICGKKMVLQLQDQVGKGSFATVWKASSADGSVFAVKIIDDGRVQVTLDSQNEAELLEQLDTQFVVAVYGSAMTGSSMAIAMEYYPLGSLQKVLQDDALSHHARIPILKDIACSMEYLHSLGIVHRDLKPGNVLVCSLDPQTRPMCKFVTISHP